MVDVRWRMEGFTPAHIAGLRHLSARAAVAPSSAHARNGLLSFSALPEQVITHLRSSGIEFQSGLSNPEFACAEAEVRFTLPPDLPPIPSISLPVGPRFPDWHAGGARLHLRASIDLPVAAITFRVAGNSLLSKSWGLRPLEPVMALWVARNALKRAPVLIPIFNHCYIPCSQPLAGSPVFFVHEDRIFCCTSDLSDFFERESLFCSSQRDPEVFTKQRSARRSSDAAPAAAKTPRWVEFRSEAATDRRRRNSSSSSTSSPNRKST